MIKRWLRWLLYNCVYTTVKSYNDYRWKNIYLVYEQLRIDGWCLIAYVWYFLNIWVDKHWLWRTARLFNFLFDGWWSLDRKNSWLLRPFHWWTQSIVLVNPSRGGILQCHGAICSCWPASGRIDDSPPVTKHEKNKASSIAHRWTID